MMRRNYKKTMFLVMAMALSAQNSHADEAALYDAPAPADAVFVRMLSGFGSASDTLNFGGSVFSLPDGAKDTYVAISASVLQGKTPGTYYSVISDDQGGMVVKEPDRETASKVHLFLINAGTDPVRLILPENGAEVVGPVQAGAVDSRAVNPVSASLAVERVSDGQIIGHFDVKLSRGQNLSFVAGPEMARLVKNTFGPVLTPN